MYSRKLAHYRFLPRLSINWASSKAQTRMDDSRLLRYSIVALTGAERCAFPLSHLLRGGAIGSTQAFEA